ncbi:UNVERIFIED_CONTAM: hypothetical protein Sindi_1260500 [Sesamum indicum]
MVFREMKRKKGDLSHNDQLAKGFLEMEQRLISANRQDDLLLQLEHCCQLVLAKAAKLEQVMLQQRAKMQWMKEGDQCSRVFFRKIAQRRSVRRILQINDDHGTTHTDLGAINNEFVDYYHNLLGGGMRHEVINLSFLRPWARYRLSDEEENLLLAPFTPADTKQALFDIAEDKTPGPDGYSSGFFKAAWPIVGQEVSFVVLEFFRTGRLLKQINTTLLALILESVPSDICARTKHWRQYYASAGTLHGVNQARLPPRCELKVDIRKTYDTVEWDFLIAAMRLFSFPATFIMWIEACITTPSFSIGIKGKPTGSSRGPEDFGRVTGSHLTYLCL